jgi:hypothetical protein
MNIRWSAAAHEEVGLTRLAPGGDAPLEPRLVCQLLRCLEAELGTFSLNALLRQSQVFASLSSGTSLEERRLLGWAQDHPVLISQFAGLQAELRQFYGVGGRGALNRIGRSLWRLMVAEATVTERGHLLSLRVGPHTGRRKRLLEYLAQRLPSAGQPATVRTAGADLLLVDAFSLAEAQPVAEPACWLVQGLIQEALQWATGQEHEVEEEACRAMGATACQFRVRTR